MPVCPIMRVGRVYCCNSVTLMIQQNIAHQDGIVYEYVRQGFLQHILCHLQLGTKFSAPKKDPTDFLLAKTLLTNLGFPVQPPPPSSYTRPLNCMNN